MNNFLVPTKDPRIAPGGAVKYAYLRPPGTWNNPTQQDTPILSPMSVEVEVGFYADGVERHISEKPASSRTITLNLPTGALFRPADTSGAAESAMWYRNDADHGQMVPPPGQAAPIALPYTIDDDEQLSAWAHDALTAIVRTSFYLQVLRATTQVTSLQRYSADIDSAVLDMWRSFDILGDAAGIADDLNEIVGLGENADSWVDLIPNKTINARKQMGGFPSFRSIRNHPSKSITLIQTAQRNLAQEAIRSYKDAQTAASVVADLDGPDLASDIENLVFAIDFATLNRFAYPHAPEPVPETEFEKYQTYEGNIVTLGIKGINDTHKKFDLTTEMSEMFAYYAELRENYDI